jgi:hypothetical protein
VSNRKILRRTNVQGLDPRDCCFIFPFPKEDRRPVFRRYLRDENGERNGRFLDYEIRGGVTPFVKFVYDDVELKEILVAGEVHYEMDFPEFVMNPKYSRLTPGESENYPET